MKYLSSLLSLIRQTFKEFTQKKPLLLGASTAFFTVFALPSIILLLVSILSLYFKQEMLTQKLFAQVSEYFGADTAKKIQVIVQNFRSQANSIWMTVVGAIFLLFVSTTLFHVIRLALNETWSVRIKKGTKFKYTLLQHLSAFVLILISGALFFSSLLADATLALFHDYFEAWLPATTTIIEVLGAVVSLVIVTAWFSILFRFLPDANTNWNTTIRGALFTAVLFNMGKYVLAFFLSADNLDDIFGASASIMGLFLFIFYSSMIMYFGAMFTKVYAEHVKRPIRPKKHGEIYRVAQS
jgi:membrane protein